MKKIKETEKRSVNRRRFLTDAIVGIGAASIIGNISAQSSNSVAPAIVTSNAQSKVAFVIHGGAGVPSRKEMTAAMEKDYRTALMLALTTGAKVLQSGRDGLDAVTAAINVMEDSPLFNAGKGAVFTSAGTNELDSSIMEGKTLQAGAVAGLKHIKNPINLARMVMEKSPHVMMVGDGAEAFARQMGVPFVDQKYFFTERRWKALQEIKQEEKLKKKISQLTEEPYIIKSYFGTVGAVALDAAGNLSAGTSTGGMTNKKFGRVGDSPIIGAGTYANNATCAVSATGDGEYFIRLGVARDVSAMMEYGKMSLAEAAKAAIAKVGKLGGEGGIICLDKSGNIAMPFNSEGMFRAAMSLDGKMTVDIY